MRDATEEKTEYDAMDGKRRNVYDARYIGGLMEDLSELFPVLTRMKLSMTVIGMDVSKVEEMQEKLEELSADVASRWTECKAANGVPGYPEDDAE